MTFPPFLCAFTVTGTMVDERPRLCNSAIVPSDAMFVASSHDTTRLALLPTA
jgi:hypothetical protein